MICAHCEADKASLGFVIQRSNGDEEGFCCDPFCLNAYFKQTLTTMIHEQKREYTKALLMIKAKIREGVVVTPFIKQFNRCVVLSISTFHFLLEKDEANYRLFCAKALEEWVELIQLSPDDGLLLQNGKGSKEFFKWCKQAEPFFFPPSIF